MGHSCGAEAEVQAHRSKLKIEAPPGSWCIETIRSRDETDDAADGRAPICALGTDGRRIYVGWSSEFETKVEAALLIFLDGAVEVEFQHVDRAGLS